MPSDTDIPFSVNELRLAAKQPRDEYHRELMAWAATEIDALLQLLQDHNYSDTVNHVPGMMHEWKKRRNH